jgi:hypothetical protein
MNKHTPGPWNVSDHVNNNEIVVRSNDGDIVANLKCDRVHNSMNGKTEVEANARLIARAPELLEALRKAEASMYSLHESNALDDEDYAALKAVTQAIAKAEGRNS